MIASSVSAIGLFGVPIKILIGGAAKTADEHTNQRAALIIGLDVAGVGPKARYPPKPSTESDSEANLIIVCALADAEGKISVSFAANQFPRVGG